MVGPDNKVALHTLQLRGTSGNQWIVENGLDDGDRVIVAGLQKAQPGALVQAVEAQPADAAAAPSPPPVTGEPGPTAQSPKLASRAIVARAN